MPRPPLVFRCVFSGRLLVGSSNFTEHTDLFCWPQAWQLWQASSCWMLSPCTFWVCFGTALTSMLQRKLLLATGVAALPALTLLDLSDNFLSGPLPNDWSRAVQLEFMLLENNAFSGALP